MRCLDPVIKGAYEYDPYSAYGKDSTQWPDTDWYITGDQPITS